MRTIGLFFCFILGISMLSCTSDDGSELELDDQVFTISEDVTVGSLVGKIPVPDMDVSLELVSGDALGSFTLSDDGKLTVQLADHIDFEETEKYELVVEASRGNEVVQAQVVVHVTDVDETNLMLLNGSRYDFSNQAFITYNGVDVQFFPEENETSVHYAYSFSISDGEMIAGEYGYEFENMKIYINAALLAAHQGDEGFSSGTFQYFPVDTNAHELKDVHYFSFVFIILDRNGNGISYDDLLSDSVYVITDGIIKVSLGEENRGQLDFDVLASQIEFDDVELETYHIIEGTERHLRFSYNGTFAEEDGDETVVEPRNIATLKPR